MIHHTQESLHLLTHNNAALGSLLLNQVTWPTFFRFFLTRIFNNFCCSFLTSPTFLRQSDFVSTGFEKTWVVWELKWNKNRLGFLGWCCNKINQTSLPIFPQKSWMNVLLVFQFSLVVWKCPWLSELIQLIFFRSIKSGAGLNFYSAESPHYIDSTTTVWFHLLIQKKELCFLHFSTSIHYPLHYYCRHYFSKSPPSGVWWWQWTWGQWLLPGILRGTLNNHQTQQILPHEISCTY